MRVETGLMVPLGYGKYFRSDAIIGLEPIEDDRGPGRRTFVYVRNQEEPIVASRGESTILRDMTEMPGEISRAQDQRQLLLDILDSIEEIDPMMRRIIRDQGQWDLNRLEERIRDVVEE